MDSRTVQNLRRASGTLLAIALGGSSLWLLRHRRLFTVNEITTGRSLDYPELRPHVYWASQAAAFRAAVDALADVRGMRVVRADEEATTVYVEAETLLGGFIDDVQIAVTALGASHARVIITSRSRFGRGDLGENARHIGAIQTAMDKRLIGG